MKVILLQDVPKIGRRGTVVDVSEGYARNFLFPHKHAEPATPEKVTALERQVNAVRIEKDIQENLLEKSMRELDGKRVSLSAQANEKGHLFQGIHEKEILEQLLAQHHIELEPGMLTDFKPIKEVGEHPIEVRLKNQRAAFFVEVKSI